MEVRKHDGVKLPLHIWGIREVTAGRSKQFVPASDRLGPFLVDCSVRPRPNDLPFEQRIRQLAQDRVKFTSQP